MDNRLKTTALPDSLSKHLEKVVLSQQEETVEDSAHQVIVLCLETEKGNKTDWGMEWLLCEEINKTGCFSLEKR